MKITKNNIDDIFKSKTYSVETMQLKGYELVTELFCDSSGFGMDNEPALTQSQLINTVKNLLTEHEVMYSTITGQGMFQVYVGLFTKTGKKVSKRISTNVLEINQDNKKIIRLYDTNIVIFDGDKTILNSGGFKTVTTKKWINKYINGFVYQKNFDWFVQINDHTTLPFEDGMII